MRILFVSDTYYPHINGVYYFVCRVAPLLRQKGHEVAVIAPSATIFSTKSKIDDIDVYGIPSLPILFYPNVRLPIPLLLKSRINSLLKKFKPDIIHIQDHFSISAAVVSVNKKQGTPIIGTNHFMPENLTALIHSEKWKKKLSISLWKSFSKVYNQLLLVSTPSETAAELIRPKLNVEVLSISSGIDLAIFNPYGDTANIRKKYAIPNKPILLFVGRVDPEKHLEEVIHAVALAIKKNDFYFVIVGKGIAKQSLENLAKELGIADKVVFTGFVPEEDLPFFYKLSRCFIIASIAELLSLATLQAMASGLPIIAANACALGELVEVGVNGYLFDTGDIDTIAESICKVIDQDDLYRDMGKNNLEYIMRHDIHKVVDSFEKIYEMVSIPKKEMAY
jgi:glycosyltransferase involved in cell wall biosynthesis